MRSSPVIEYQLGDAGWAELVIESDNSRHVVSGISYLTDALDDFVRMGIDVVTDKGYGLAIFYHEPGSTVLLAETAWLQDGSWGQGCRLSAISGPEYGDPAPGLSDLQDCERDFVVEFQSRDSLGGAIRDACQRVLEQHGVEGYARKWTGRLGFPLRALAALRCALEAEALPERDYS